MMDYQRRRRRRRCHDDDTKKEAGQYDGEKGCTYVRRLTVAIMNLTLIATLSSMSASSSSSSIGVALGFCSHHRYQRQHRPPSSFLSAVGVTASMSSSVISVPPLNSRMGRRSSDYLTRQNYISSSSSSSFTDQYFGCDTIYDVANTDENNSSSSSSMMLVGKNGGADTVPTSSSSSSSPAIVTNNNTTTAPTTKIQQKYSILSRYRRRQVLRSSSYSSSFRRLQLRQQNNYNLTTTSASISSSRRSRRKSSSSSKTESMSRLEYEQRKAAWAAKYTSVTTLRATFGTNRNKFWGDFDACTTRKLYHTLLPRALLELRILRDGLINYSDTTNSSTTSETNSKKKKRMMKGEQRCWSWKKKKRNQVDGRQQREDERMRINNVAVNDINNSNTNSKNNEEEDEFVLDNITYLQQELKELAPLAFRARLAAKEYARERSRLPGRIGSMLYDGYRSWIKYGKWKSSGMTWEQVWNKYEDQVLNEAKISNVVGKPTTNATTNTEQQQQQMLTPLRSERTIRDDDNDITTAATNSVEISTITSLLRGDDNYNLNDDELTARICLRILERSVVTNDAIDRLFLKQRGTAEDDDIQQQQHQQLNDVGGGNNSSSTSPTVNNSNIKDGILIVDGTSKRQQRKLKRKLLLQEQKRRLKLRMQADLQSIEKKFDEDIQELLRYSSLSSTNGDTRRNSRRKERGTYFWERDELMSSSSSISGSTVVGTDEINATDNDDNERKVTLMEFDTHNNNIDDAVILGNVQNNISSSPLRKLSTNEVATLRILVKTRKRLTQLLRRTR